MWIYSIIFLLNLLASSEAIEVVFRLFITIGNNNNSNKQIKSANHRSWNLRTFEAPLSGKSLQSLFFFYKINGWSTLLRCSALGRPYPFKFLKDYLPQILLGPFSDTWIIFVWKKYLKSSLSDVFLKVFGFKNSQNEQKSIHNGLTFEKLL